YLLVVEGGRIDHGHHEGKAGYALAQTVEFSKAVASVVEQVDLRDTLIIVTADHSHTLTIGGYPTRGNPILGMVVANDANGDPKQSPEIAADGQPYATLAYQNGPGASHLHRGAPSTGIDAVQQALVPTAYELPGMQSLPAGTHSGEDVALYAIGAGARHFGGVLEQEQVFHRITRALAWDDRAQ
ncbi:MAG: alkaline phosphatase, partial [Pseudomonadales bacterium]|nr:alkaline phosphatase [Pseudomonadales bacterium]